LSDGLFDVLFMDRKLSSDRSSDRELPPKGYDRKRSVLLKWEDWNLSDAKFDALDRKLSDRKLSALLKLECCGSNGSTD
jgi:hypothetical protein